MKEITDQETKKILQTTFKYFIIMKNRKNVTVFNNFDINIVSSASIISFISLLPATIYEYISDWPLSTGGEFIKSYNNKYDIIYVYENDIVTLEKIIKNTIFGCVFLMNDLKSENVRTIMKLTKMPVISQENQKYNKRVLGMNKNAFMRIFRIWDEKLVSRGSKDKTNFAGLKIQTAKFLDPISNVIDRMRGKYFTTGENLYMTKPSGSSNYNEKETEAPILITKNLQQFVSEKMLIELLCYLEVQSDDWIVSNNFNDLISLHGIRIEELIDLLNRKKWIEYEELTGKIMNTFDELTIIVDMILCIPSINFFVMNEINSMLGKGKYPNKFVRSIVDQNTYYEVIESNVYSNHDSEREKLLLEHLLRYKIERSKEVTLLSYMYVNYALARRIPFIRGKNVPSFQLYKYFVDLKSYCDDIQYGSVEPLKRLNTTMNKVSDIIRDSFEESIWKLIIKHSKHIKILTDLPIEWVRIEGVPLCLTHSVSRVPITPANGLVVHSYVNRELVLNYKAIKIVIINALKKSEEIFQFGIKLYDFLKDTLSEHVFSITYYEVDNKEEFVHILNKDTPDIFVYYGHGKYNQEENVGELSIRDSSINSFELRERVKRFPPIVILGACETQVAWGSSEDIANTFINSGSIAVLGTYFEVDAVYTYKFIIRLFNDLMQFYEIHSKKSVFWNELIHDIMQKHYILDCFISLNNYLQKKSEKVIDEESFAERFFEISKDRQLSEFEMFRDRDSIILDLLHEESDNLSNYYRFLVSENRIFYQGLFYASLGSPENIKIEKN